MTLLVACKRCNRAFGYSDRGAADNLCPDCDKGPFDDWFFELGAWDR